LVYGYDLLHDRAQLVFRHLYGTLPLSARRLPSSSPEMPERYAVCWPPADAGRPVPAVIDFPGCAPVQFAEVLTSLAG
jgi:hypothetical protein